MARKEKTAFRRFFLKVGTLSWGTHGTEVTGSEHHWNQILFYQFSRYCGDTSRISAK